MRARVIVGKRLHTSCLRELLQKFEISAFAFEQSERKYIREYREIYREKLKKITILPQLQVQCAKCLRRRTLNFVPFPGQFSSAGRRQSQTLASSKDLLLYRDTRNSRADVPRRCGLALSLSQVSCCLGYGSFDFALSFIILSMSLDFT